MKRTKRFHWKNAAALGACVLLLAGTLAGCGDSGQSESGGSRAAGSQAQNSSAAGGQTESDPAESSRSGGSESGQAAAEPAVTGSSAADRERTTIRVGSLKGATSLGLLNLMDRASKGETADSYEFQMAAGADELLPRMVRGELDMALVPANVAAVLYQKTDGDVEVIDINTLGVLYMVTGTAQVSSIADLRGKTVCLTGKGTTPEASLRYLLEANGLSEEDVALEFKSEATEVAAILAENPDAVGLLPQPFVTAACMQNESLKVVLDINGEWTRVQGDDNGMVTGVTVVRREFLEENPAAVEAFLKEHAASAAAINEDPAAGAVLAVEAGIVAKEPIAQKAIPQCNITCVTGEEMKAALSGYLKVLNDFNAELVGGALPGDDFYYLP